METKEQKTIFKPKLRVQYLNEDGTIISDRLVDQAIEFNTGPKSGHDGPAKFEVTLMNKQDVESFKAYLDRIAGNLPAKTNNGIGRPSKTAVEFNSPREEILEEVKKSVADGANQDDIIRYLRNLGFVFLLTEDFLSYFPDFTFKSRDVSEPNSSGQYPNSLSWMVRCIKRAKDPKSDKYDPQIIFGFSILKEREKKVVPYLYKERKEPIKAEVPKKRALSFNNLEMTKFPKYMTEEERLKFSTEMRQLMASPERKPSKFFSRWFQDVIFPDAQKEKMNEIIVR